MERRFLEDTETRVDSDAGISGLAARYYDGTPGTEYRIGEGAVERIKKGAFSQAIHRGDDVRALFNHNPDNLLGRTSSNTLELSDEAKGLRYRVKPGATAIAKDIVEMVRRGDLAGSSFAFTVDDESWETNSDGLDVREIRSVKLYDVGPVTYPAYESSTVQLNSSVDNTGAMDSWKKFRNDKMNKQVKKVLDQSENDPI